jgi:sulfur carrier protein
VPDGATVADLLAEVGADDRGIAVAVDGTVVRRATWATTTLSPGTRVEIVGASQGG